MPILTVDDLNDPRLDDYRNVPDPVLLERHGLFVAEGRLVVERLLTASRFGTRSVMVTDSALAPMRELFGAPGPVPVYVVPREVMNGITGFNVHRGCLAIGERRPPDDTVDLVRRARRIVVLERVGNADNVGGIFRNAAAFGADAVVLDTASADPLYRKAIRTSMGAALQVPFARAESWPAALQTLRAEGLLLVALTPGPGAVPISRIAADLDDRRVALVLGHEGEGLTPAALGRCDLGVSIPMAPGIDSLNVATAAAVALYELQRGNLEQKAGDL